VNTEIFHFWVLRLRQKRYKNTKAYLKKHLAGFKVPKAFIIVDQLPKNPAGKLLKREIKNSKLKLQP
jgi:acyl-CoA synthetase (AMP-forming)/AMP-acid ligase II